MPTGAISTCPPPRGSAISIPPSRSCACLGGELGVPLCYCLGDTQSRAGHPLSAPLLESKSLLLFEPFSEHTGAQQLCSPILSKGFHGEVACPTGSDSAKIPLLWHGKNWEASGTSAPLYLLALQAGLEEDLGCRHISRGSYSSPGMSPKGDGHLPAAARGSQSAVQHGESWRWVNEVAAV